MCGIAGICHIDGPDGLSLSIMKKMIGVLCHRGPDETGVYLDDYVGLGHARLSIIDLSSGVQPIHNEDETLWIIYNGEVFNYVELKKELEEKGHRFYTTSDTEVILHLYEEEGADCVTRLNGQFALAVWDVKTRTLFLARDRVGIRPLFYTIVDNTLIFGSEIKSIFMNANVPRRIDPVAMGQRGEHDRSRVLDRAVVAPALRRRAGADRDLLRVRRLGCVGVSAPLPALPVR